jgi:VanZ family protein
MYTNIKNKEYVLQYIIPILVWMSLIFYFSSQPATESSVLSGGITAYIYKFLNLVGLAKYVSITMLHHIIRKCAHLTIYFILGVLVDRAVALKTVKSRGSYRVVIAFSICVFYASTDEFHQLFVSGRGSQLKDVFIDSAGALAGIIIHMLKIKDN